MSELKDVPINGADRVPLIIDLPAGSSDYFEIIGKSLTVTLQSGLVTLQPGQDIGSHNTENYEELIVVLKGHGEVETDGFGRRKITKGQIAYNPPQTQHNVYNVGSGILRYIYIVANTAKAM